MSISVFFSSLLCVKLQYGKMRKNDQPPQPQKEVQTMTEKEKRTLGLLYDNNYDPELAAELSTCKDLCYACNQIPPSHLKERQEAFRKIFGKTSPIF